MNWDDLQKIIIAILALYGAFISTYNFLIYRRTNRPNIKVILEYSSAYISHGFITSRTHSNRTPELLVKVVNSGSRPVTVSVPFFRLPKRKGKLLCPNPVSNESFPAELTEGKYLMVFFASSKISKAFQDAGFTGIHTLIAYCNDSVEKTYKSKGIKFDVDKCSPNKDQ